MTTTAPALSGQDIGNAAAATRPLLTRIIEPAGLSFEQWVVLRMLAVKSGAAERAAFEAELAKNLSTDRTEAIALVDDALASGRVQSGDELGFSDVGAALYAQLWSQMTALQTRLYGDFPQHDLETTHRVLVEVTRRATEMLQTA